MNQSLNGMIRIALLGTLVAIGNVGAVSASQGAAAATSTEDQAQEAWRATMHKVHAPAAGCWHASYPSTD